MRKRQRSGRLTVHAVGPWLVRVEVDGRRPETVRVTSLKELQQAVATARNWLRQKGTDGNWWSPNLQQVFQEVAQWEQKKAIPQSWRYPTLEDMVRAWTPQFSLPTREIFGVWSTTEACKTGNWQQVVTTMEMEAARVEEEEKQRIARERENQFEVNLTEPLVGWRRWRINRDRLISYGGRMVWVPGEENKALCYVGIRNGPPAFGASVVRTDCTCGFYAVDQRKDVNPTHGPILGQVSGWGRYVRGETGWRAEKAYPKSFWLQAEQASEETMDVLKQFGVPIIVEVPQVLYNPQEEGWEDGNWEDEENGNSGATEVAGATEEDGEERD